MNQMSLSVLVFVLVYGIIITEKINKVAISLFGATLIIIIGILDFDSAVNYIEFNTIGLLVGMMIIVSVLSHTGIFEYLAIKTAKKVKGDPWKLLVILGILTAVASAFLDNVTVVLLVVPVTLVITETLAIDPRPFLVSQVVLSNIGGTATLIGDPPNVMIGGSTDLTFNDFLVNLGPIVIITMIVYVIIYKYIYKKGLTVSKENVELLLKIDENQSITNKNLLMKSLIVLVLTIASFWGAEQFHIELSVIALFFSGIILAITNVDVEEIFHNVEWSTLMFFMALFVLVGALVEVGAIEVFANAMLILTKGDLLVTTFVILWGAGIASAFLNNIPFVATMIPLITTLGANGMDVTPLWWALALGACFGGNGTIIGSSAGVIVAGVSKKQGYQIDFFSFMKVNFPMMILSLVISSICLYIKFFI